MSIPKGITETKNVCVIGLTTEADRLFDIRRNRLNSLKENEASDYTNLEKIKMKLINLRNYLRKINGPLLM